ARPDESRGNYNFAPGAGVIEEEEIAHSDEEQDFSEYRESSEDDTEFEELEEETLEADDDASRKETEIIAASEGLAAAFAESRRTNGEAESFLEEDLDEEAGDEDEGEIEGHAGDEEEDAEVLASGLE